MKSHEELLVCTAADKVQYDNIIRGLPNRLGYNDNYLDEKGVEIPHGSGSHVLQHIRATLEIVKPERILEIGFCMGYSAAMFLELSNAEVASIEVSTRGVTVDAAIFLQAKYRPRFKIHFGIGKEVQPLLGTYDLAFIDGAHDEASVIADIELCRDLKIPYILADDCMERYGDAGKAYAKFDDQLELVKNMDNIKLFKWK